ncbi:MAG: hypothetical protein U0133_02045 [Gemmatimonadales bacterium]
MSMLALSWFHVVHGPTVFRGLGIRAPRLEYREERRRHVVNMVVQGVRGRLRGQGIRGEKQGFLATLGMTEVLVALGMTKSLCARNDKLAYDI